MDRSQMEEQINQVPRQRFVLFTLTAFYMIFYVGAFFGFGPMQLMLEEDEAFSQLCYDNSFVNSTTASENNVPDVCTAQSRTLQFVSFTATILAQLMTPIFGEVSDRYGAFVLQAAVLFMGCIGILMILVSSLTKVYDLLYLAFILIGFMSMASAPLVMELAQLYSHPSSRRRVISSLNCLWDVGGGFGYWVLWVIFNSSGLSFLLVIGLYLVVGFLIFGASTYLWKVIMVGRSKDCSTLFVDNTNTTAAESITINECNGSLPSHHSRTSFIKQVTSTRFVILTALFSIHVSRILFTLTSARDFLRYLGDDKTGNRYLTILSLLSPVAILGLPMVEFCVEKWGYLISMQIINAYAIVHGIILLASHNLKIQIIGFVLLALYRCFTFAIILSYMEVIMEKHAIGKLTGVICLVPGLVQLVNLPLTNWALGPLDGDYFWPNLIYTLCIIPCILGVWYLGHLQNHRRSSLSLPDLQLSLT